MSLRTGKGQGVRRHLRLRIDLPDADATTQHHETEDRDPWHVVQAPSVPARRDRPWKEGSAAAPCKLPTQPTLLLLSADAFNQARAAVVLGTDVQYAWPRFEAAGPRGQMCRSTCHHAPDDAGHFDFSVAQMYLLLLYTGALSLLASRTRPR